MEATISRSRNSRRSRLGSRLEEQKDRVPKRDSNVLGLLVRVPDYGTNVYPDGAKITKGRLP